MTYFDSVEAERQARISQDHEWARIRIGASTDAFRMDPRWYDPWRGSNAQLIERMRPYTWLLYPVMIRHITAPSHLVPWHQDIAYVRRMARVHPRLITCFVPLELEPSRTASLEFALGEFGDLAHADHDEHGPGLDGPFAETVRFPLALGDALIFGDHTPHRSVTAADGVIDRRSFEFRAVVPQDALDDRDYFDLERNQMVHRTAGRIIDVDEPGAT